MPREGAMLLDPMRAVTGAEVARGLEMLREVGSSADWQSLLQGCFDDDMDRLIRTWERVADFVVPIELPDERRGQALGPIINSLRQRMVGVFIRSFLRGL